MRTYLLFIWSKISFYPRMPCLSCPTRHNHNLEGLFSKTRCDSVHMFELAYKEGDGSIFLGFLWCNE